MADSGGAGDGNMEKRREAIKELVESEQAYLDTLHVLLQVYFYPLLEAGMTSRPILPKEQVFPVFNDVTDIAFVSQELLRRLEARWASYTVHTNVGDVFLGLLPSLKQYRAYIGAFPESQRIVNKLLEKQGTFANWVAEQQKVPECAGRDLTNFLVAPVQRLPRYKLFLERLVKYTPADHEDHRLCQQALASIVDIADGANEYMRDRANLMRLMAVQNRFVGPKVKNIVTSDRVVLKEGSTVKISRKKMQPRFVVLFSDILVYGAPIAGGNKVLFKRMIPLEGVSVTEEDDAEGRFLFLVTSPQKSFRMICDSASDRDDWVIAITKALKKLSSAQGVGRQSGLAFKAPVWVPDGDATACMLCDRAFTRFQRRRHHCRYCGKLVCGQCSSKRLFLPNVGNKPVRVCDGCFSALSMQSMRVQSEMLLPGTRGGSVAVHVQSTRSVGSRRRGSKGSRGSASAGSRGAGGSVGSAGQRRVYSPAAASRTPVATGSRAQPDAGSSGSRSQRARNLMQRLLPAVPAPDRDEAAADQEIEGKASMMFVPPAPADTVASTGSRGQRPSHAAGRSGTTGSRGSRGSGRRGRGTSGRRAGSAGSGRRAGSSAGSRGGSRGGRSSRGGRGRRAAGSQRRKPGA